MRVLITGGCGFIGSHLVEHHLLKGDHVVVVDNLSSGSLGNVASFENNPLFHFEHANITTWKNLESVVSKIDCIYHTAAIVGVYRVLKEPLQALNENVAGCNCLLKAVVENNPQARVLIMSSSSVYGYNKNKTLREDDELIIRAHDPLMWTYGVSKVNNEAVALAYYRAHKTKVTSLRLFNIIGPRQTGRYGMVVPRFVAQACNNEPITVYGEGTQTRSFCDVRDAITAIALLAENPTTYGQVYNVGNDSEITINKLADIVRQRANSHSEIKHIPYCEIYGADYMDTPHRKPDLTKLMTTTGFKLNWALDQTIEDLIALQNKNK